jgi:uncharacterized protein
MALYCIHAFDKPGAAALRANTYAAHRAYLASATGLGIVIHASGPLVAEDGENAVGSLFVIEAADATAAASFNAGDPFAKAGLWSRVDVTRFSLRRGTVGSAAPPAV